MQIHGRDDSNGSGWVVWVGEINKSEESIEVKDTGLCSMKQGWLVGWVGEWVTGWVSVCIWWLKVVGMVDS